MEELIDICGKINVTSWYADNEIYLQEVRFLIPGHAWYEFETSPLYQELVEYLGNLRIPSRRSDFQQDAGCR